MKSILQEKYELESEKTELSIENEHYQDKIDDNESRLNWINRRLAEINNLQTTDRKE